MILFEDCLLLVKSLMDLISDQVAGVCEFLGKDENVVIDKGFLILDECGEFFNVFFVHFVLNLDLLGSGHDSIDAFYFSFKVFDVPIRVLTEMNGRFFEGHLGL